MNISELSIRRPVLSTVLTLIILLFGFIGYNYLGVREYPSVDNPIISVSCSYPGANADVIENQTADALSDLVPTHRINWVWMPPWGPDKITDDGRDQLRALGFNI